MAPLVFARVIGLAEHLQIVLVVNAGKRVIAFAQIHLVLVVNLQTIQGNLIASLTPEARSFLGCLLGLGPAMVLVEPGSTRVRAEPAPARRELSPAPTGAGLPVRR